MRQNRLMMRGLFAIAAAARLLYVGAAASRRFDALRADPLRRASAAADAARGPHAASSAIRFGRRFPGGFAPPGGVQPDVPPAKRFIKSFDGRPRYLLACRASR
jgi:hypothetical protein